MSYYDFDRLKVRREVGKQKSQEKQLHSVEEVLEFIFSHNASLPMSKKIIKPTE